MLGSCIETIQPMILTAEFSREAWLCLQKMYANKYRSRVLSLKLNLMQNPRGDRPVREYLKDMKSIADALALTDNPISDEDLFLNIINQLGPDYRDLVSALRVRETPISYDDLFDQLTAVEAQLKKDITPVIEAPVALTIPTANYVNRKFNHHQKSHGSEANQQSTPSVQHSR